MRHFFETDFSNVKNRTVLLDIDGTLLADGLSEPDEAVIRKVAELKKSNEIYLCSNKKDHQRNRQLAQLLGVSYFETNQRKPLIDLTVDTVIGDKFLTDGLLAKKAKADFIKVKRISSGKEGFINKFIYLLDNFIYGIIYW